MRERPIIFNAEMVNAILSGRKTQTRRVIKFPFIDRNMGCELSGNELAGEIAAGNFWNSTLGQPGDRLWVREKTRLSYYLPNNRAYVQYEADGKTAAVDVPSRIKHVYEGNCFSNGCYREASRITLEITGVRVERLQDISQADAIAEGGPQSHPSIDAVSRDYGFPDFSRSWFGQTWWSIYGEENWQANPWVWVIEFKRVEG